MLLEVTGVGSGFEVWGAFGVTLTLLLSAVTWLALRLKSKEDDIKEYQRKIGDLNKEMREDLKTNQSILTRATDAMKDMLSTMTIVPEKVRTEVIAVVKVVEEKAKVTHDKLDEIIKNS